MHPLVFGLCGVLALATTGSADCARDFLKNATDTLVAALGIPNGVANMPLISSSIDYNENDKKVAIRSGVLQQGMKIDHNRSTHDTTQCATFTEIIVTDPKAPYVIGAVMRFTNDTITKMESVITTTGDWAFNAKNSLGYVLKEDWSEIPMAQRDSREIIQHAGDAYSDAFSNKSSVVPFYVPCNRMEGGGYTGTGSPTDSCGGFPSGVSLTSRRYVIDETVGSVDVMSHFGGAPDTHEYRVLNGKIRYVHTMTMMRGGK